MTNFTHCHVQEPTCPCSYGGISSCPVLPSQDFLLPVSWIFVCYKLMSFTKDVKHHLPFQEEYFPAIKEWGKKNIYKKHKNATKVRAYSWNPKKQIKPSQLYLLLFAFNSQYLKPSLKVLLGRREGGREQDNELITCSILKIICSSDTSVQRGDGREGAVVFHTPKSTVYIHNQLSSTATCFRRGSKQIYGRLILDYKSPRKFSSQHPQVRGWFIPNI